ncbi:MAG: GNAT family N-acetyltransferase [Chloroflexi bacterium]|nr:GNAT family N-acetyltransferase [Chloroflexota bacterium]
MIAEDTETSEIVGAGFISFGNGNVLGEQRRYAALKGLVVHPAYRKRGIGKQLAHKRLELAQDRLSTDGLIIATIQKNNAASLSVASKWGKLCLRLLLVGPLK